MPPKLTAPAASETSRRPEAVVSVAEPSVTCLSTPAVPPEKAWVPVPVQSASCRLAATVSMIVAADSVLGVPTASKFEFQPVMTAAWLGVALGENWRTNWFPFLASCAAVAVTAGSVANLAERALPATPAASASNLMPLR